MTRSTIKELPREASLYQSPPSYEELKQPDCHHHHHDVVPEFPPPTATPTEVADFLVRLLVANEMPIDRATRIAAKWTLGSGKELCNYPAVMYLDIFGKEDGWVTYIAAKKAIHKEKSEDFWYRNRTHEYHSPADAVEIQLTFS